jgi:hypothetical protein
MMTKLHIALATAWLAVGLASGCASSTNDIGPSARRSPERPAVDPERASSTREPTTSPTAPEAISAGSCVCGTEPGCPPCPAPLVAPTTTSAVRGHATAPHVFPPAPVPPPHARTAKPGDGVFSRLAVHRASASESPVATTTIHPHPIRRDVSVLVVAFDRSRLDLELVAGTDEPEGTKVPRERRTGLVAPSDLDDLVGVLNGAFKRRHGGHGIGIRGEVLWPATAEGCVFAEANDGTYRIAPWSTLQGEEATLDWWRQSPPCLVAAGVKHPDLSNEYRAKKWGGAEDGKKDIRRSAIAIGPDPGVVYFAIGEWVTAEWLADALVAVGASAVAELDINYSYTKLLFYRHEGAGQLAVEAPLIDDLKLPKKLYWSEPADRDFFYVRWR